MNRQLLASAKSDQAVAPARGGGVLQRKCECGAHTPGGSTCESCEKGSKPLQRKLAIGSSHDPLESEADRIATEVMTRPARPGVSVAPVRVQRLAAHGSSRAGEAPASVDHVLSGSGQPLESDLLDEMGSRFGHDFSQVRVHQGGAAEQSAREISARAYTTGNNIVFGAGAYAPATAEGRHLLAHELTHVVQQVDGGGTSAPQVQRKGTTFGGFFANLGRGFLSIFGDEPGYDDADLLAYMRILDTTNDIEDDADSDNKARAVVAKWNSGVAAFKLNSGQMALLIREMESGFVSGADEKAITLLRQSRQAYIEAAKVDPLNPGTHALSATDKAAAIDALVPVPGKGKPPTFKEDLGPSSGKYGPRIKARLTALISSFHKSLFEDKEPLRADPGKNFHGWSVLEAPCKASKGVVDDLYDSNYGGGAAKPELTNAGGNLIDQWTDEIAVNAGKTDPQKKAKAREKVEYLIDSNCRTINTDHSAVPSRAAEAAILKPIIDGFVSDGDPAIEAKKVQTMLELDIGWEGAQLDGKVYLQQYKSTASDANMAKEENRVQMWGLFQTCIHEYIHTLAHPDFNTWAQKFRNAKDKTRYNTLIEGFCDFFTLNARKTIDYKKVQALVEGPYANGNPPAPDESGVYPSNVEAERVVGIVGIKNAQAAYFGGKVDLMGGP